MFNLSTEKNREYFFVDYPSNGKIEKGEVTRAEIDAAEQLRQQQ